MELQNVTGRVVKAQTGLSAKKLDSLVPNFEKAMENIAIKEGRRSNPDKPGARKKYLGRHILIFTLTFMKTNLTPDACAGMFNIPRSSMYYLINQGMAALFEALNELGVIPVQNIESALEAIVLLGKKIKIDATERPIRRPKEDQGVYYSGKKKRHMVKNQLIIANDKRILVLSPTVCGSAHDFEIFKYFISSCYLAGIEVNVDLGYLGIEEFCPDAKIIIPSKKTGNKDLTDVQKEQNKIKSSERVLIENAIGGMKRMRIVSETCRFIRDSARDLVVRVCAGLWNYHLSAI